MSNLLNTSGYPFYSEDIQYAKGCYVYDKQGKSYLDMESGVWSLPLGHCDDAVCNAMTEQMKKMAHVGYKYNQQIVELCAEKLLQINQMNGKCVFLSSGSEAVEYALQLAIHISEKKKYVCLQGQYFAAYGECRKEEKWKTIPWDYTRQESVETYYEQLRRNVDFTDVGVFVFEPGNTSGLVKLPPNNLILAIAKICQENDIRIVVDEVTTGVGRTGKWFGYMYYDMKPDIIACGKGLGNGYPVSAVIMKEQVAQKALEKEFHFALSHQNDPMGARVACEVLTQIEDRKILCNTVQMGEYIENKYRMLQQEYPVISEIRARGLLICVELSEEITQEQMMRLDELLFQKGVIAGVKTKERVIRTYCPLVITAGMIDAYIDTLKQVLDAVTSL